MTGKSAILYRFVARIMPMIYRVFTPPSVHLALFRTEGLALDGERSKKRVYNQYTQLGVVWVGGHLMDGGEGGEDI